MRSLPHQPRTLRLQGVSQEPRGHVTGGVRRYPQAFERVENTPAGVVDGTGAVVGAAGGGLQSGVGHGGQPPVEVGQTYPLSLQSAFPKKCKKLHPADDLSLPFKVQLALALGRDTAGCRNKANAISRATGCSERTAKNWLAGTTEPGAADLVALMVAFDGVANLVLGRAGLDKSLVKLRALKALLEDTP